MYYSCHCIKRNGLQHDCRRTGCGGEPPCLMLPDPVCAPSQLARARGLADPAALAAHLHPQDNQGPGASANSGLGGGKRFIVCELKGIMPDVPTGDNAKCCKCLPSSTHVDIKFNNTSLSNQKNIEKCKQCSCVEIVNSLQMYTFNEKTIAEIMKRFENKELAVNSGKVALGQRSQKAKATEEPCTRPGCVHWKPPPACLWDAPCKADCFEAHPGIQPGRNPYIRSGGLAATLGRGAASDCRSTDDKIKLLMPEY